MTILARIGAFLFFLGFLGLVVFFATYQAETPMFMYFCAGSIFFVAGAFLMWKFRNPPETSDRFYTYRKMQENRRLKRENQEKAKFARTEERSRKEE